MSDGSGRGDEEGEAVSWIQSKQSNKSKNPNQHSTSFGHFIDYRRVGIMPKHTPPPTTNH